jgi:hypothetical protein
MNSDILVIRPGRTCVPYENLLEIGKGFVKKELNLKFEVVATIYLHYTRSQQATGECGHM